MTQTSPPSKKPLASINYAVVIGTTALVVALVIAGIRQARPAWYKYTGSAQVRVLTPTLTGEAELCLTCHYGIEEISEAHPVDAFGCVVCHGGDRLSLDQEAAHEGLIGGRNPSALAAVEQGCGGSDCHGGSPEEARDHIAREQRSIHSTYAGAINQALISFNQVSEGGPYYGINAVDDDESVLPDTVTHLLAFDPALFDNPSIATFAGECLTCHLGAEPVGEPYYYHSTGCASCHVLYNGAGLYAGGDPTLPTDEPGYPAQHRLTTQIPFTQCNTCHNRGSYSLEQMRFTPRDDVPAPHALPADPAQNRLAQYYQPGVLYTLCEWELDCIDCHTNKEAMGNGDIHLSQASARQVQCRTCHGTLEELPTFVTIEDPNDPAMRRATLNQFYGINVGTQVLLAPDGDTLGAIQLVGDQIVQIGKATGKRYLVPVVKGSQCEQQLDQQESYYCHECHAYKSGD